MAGKIASELKARTDESWATLTRQLRGMEPHLERSDAPGEWTTRQVLCHLLFEPGWQPAEFLRQFSERDLPDRDIATGLAEVTPERKAMTLPQLIDALDAQRRAIFAYVDTLSDAELQGRKARIPLFKQIQGSEEVPIAVYVGALFGYHWNDHAGQVAKIRKAAGLPDAT
ncbi:MAG: DinB family protein [Candidatus Rokubacteria bacterium]|nr:DinB family protein [Candidatus Rokubacteria bacterium]